MAACGAKVLHLRAVEYARRYSVPLRVRSSYNDKPGSLVTGSIEEIPLENAIITGVAHDRSEAKITVVGVPDTPGHGGADLPHGRRRRDQHRHGAAEHLPHAARRHTDITFTLPQRRRAAGGRRAPRRAAPRSGSPSSSHDDEVGKVSLIGAGMRNHPGVTATFCEALSAAGHQHRDDEHVGDPDLGDLPESTSSTRAVRALHDAFELGGDEQAVVHAGTGR